MPLAGPGRPRNNPTYAEKLKYGVQALPPSVDRILVALRLDQSRELISFALRGELPLHLSDGTATSALFGVLLNLQTVGLTHVVS